MHNFDSECLIGNNYDIKPVSTSFTVSVSPPPVSERLTGDLVTVVPSNEELGSSNSNVGAVPSSLQPPLPAVQNRERI